MKKMVLGLVVALAATALIIPAASMASPTGPKQVTVTQVLAPMALDQTAGFWAPVTDGFGNMVTPDMWGDPGGGSYLPPCNATRNGDRWCLAGYEWQCEVSYGQYYGTWVITGIGFC